jgi:glycosyltransferase involved in cell wall biosynthesis
VLVTQPEVSVIIPTKDRSHLVERALDSALSQAAVALEVVVVDDGSAPEHEARYREIVASRQRVRLVRNPESIGNPASRNVGLEHAEGHLFCTLDDDDEFLPGKLAAQVEAIERSQAEDVTAVTGVELAWSTGKTIREIPRVPQPIRLDVPGEPFTRISPRVFLNTYLVPTELMRKVDGYDPILRWGEHTDLFLRLQQVSRFVSVPMIGTRVHRDAAPGLARQAWDRKVIGVTRILEKHGDVFDAAPKLKATWQDGLGMAFLRTGRRREAIREFRAARKTYGRRFRIWRHWFAAVTHTERLLCRAPGEKVPA